MSCHTGLCSIIVSLLKSQSLLCTLCILDEQILFLHMGQINTGCMKRQKCISLFCLNTPFKISEHIAAVL